MGFRNIPLKSVAPGFHGNSWYSQIKCRLLQPPHMLAIKLEKVPCTLSFQQTPLMDRLTDCISYKQNSRFCLTGVTF